jgi:predicted ArsR family transcriptional regulator
MTGECECGKAPRVRSGAGCATCEARDRYRYAMGRPVNMLRRQLAHHDIVSLYELADACGITVPQAQNAMRELVEAGEVETIGVSNATEYRPKRRAA